MQGMGRHSTKTVSGILTSPDSFTKKRKREEGSSAEIEVDITAPEPPSKKTLRRAKKGKVVPLKPRKIGEEVGGDIEEEEQDPTEEQAKSSKRSRFGIWIGNLPWTATKADLRNFLTQNTEISDSAITRLHMPIPSKALQPMSQHRLKPQNKGFAYVDFSTQAALDEALVLSEKLFTGRRVLIKDSKSFEGRPEVVKAEDVAAGTFSGKPPSKRIFIGNLAFDVAKEDLLEHLRQCGEVDNLHVATFEDSGKCKGYAWVDFAELEGAEAAVRGWINYKEPHEDGGQNENEDEELMVTDAIGTKSRKKAKPQKWWVNKLHGRLLRREFAEDKAVRYKKRFGNDGNAQKTRITAISQSSEEGSAPTPSASHTDRKPFRKADARNIEPGAALAAAPRLTGAIIEGQGKKIVFD
ncbi:MAG: hypothetical protein Q9217_000684 [Psora testacea]